MEHLPPLPAQDMLLPAEGPACFRGSSEEVTSLREYEPMSCFWCRTQRWLMLLTGAASSTTAAMLTWLLAEYFCSSFVASITSEVGAEKAATNSDVSFSSLDHFSPFGVVGRLHIWAKPGFTAGPSVSMGVAQGYLRSALKVFWHLPVLPEQLPCLQQQRLNREPSMPQPSPQQTELLAPLPSGNERPVYAKSA